MKELYGADIIIGGHLLDYHTNSIDRNLARKNINRALKGETVVIESFAGEGGKINDILKSPIIRLKTKLTK